MYRVHICLVISLFAFLLCQFNASAQIKPKDVSTEAGLSHREMLNLINSMEKAYSAVNDYSAVFIKRERIKDKMLEEGIGKVYFKKPFNVYMEGLNGPYKGYKVIFRKGYNDDKLLINARILWKNLTFAIDPKGGLALKNNRHPITEMGIGHLIEMLLSNTRKAEENSEIELLYHGEQEVGGSMVYKIEGILPKDKSKGYYCHRAIVGIDKQNGLPIMLEAYMWDGRLYEQYIYSELRINIGVKDDIFWNFKRGAVP